MNIINELNSYIRSNISMNIINELNDNCEYVNYIGRCEWKINDIYSRKFCHAFVNDDCDRITKLCNSCNYIIQKYKNIEHLKKINIEDLVNNINNIMDDIEIIKDDIEIIKDDISLIKEKLSL